jgi:hypothetical protein
MNARILVSAGLVTFVLAVACSSDGTTAPSSGTPSVSSSSSGETSSGSSGGSSSGGSTSGSGGSTSSGANGSSSSSSSSSSGVSSSSTSSGSSSGSSSSSGSPDGGVCMAPVANQAGETCVGFGAGAPCDASCGKFGYVCFSGGPPNAMNCREMRTSAIVGNTYCCTDLVCARQPDQDTKCAGSRTFTRRFQCPLNAAGGLLVQPPPDCEEDKDAGIKGSKFYCCK